jgi:hypothetical protein
MTKKALAGAMLALMLVVGACAAPPPNEPQCTDVTTMQDTVKSVPFNSSDIASEANDDVAEMGSENRCTGYGPNQADKD